MVDEKRDIGALGGRRGGQGSRMVSEQGGKREARHFKGPL